MLQGAHMIFDLLIGENKINNPEILGVNDFLSSIVTNRDIF